MRAEREIRAGGRIKSSMVMYEMLYVMSGGNPGALKICMELLKNGRRIDPDNAFGGGVAAMYTLDALGIYEDRICALYECCGGHIGKMIAVLRAYQLGRLAGVRAETLNRAIANNEKLEIDDVIRAVKTRLPSFRWDAVA
jgi:hypothetical protein